MDSIVHYNPRLIFAQFYWLLYVTWWKIIGQLSRNNLRLRRWLPCDCFCRKKNKVKNNKSRSRISPLHLNYFSWKKNRPFSWNPLIMTLKKTGRQCCSDKYKKVKKICRKLWEGYKKNKPLSGSLVCWMIMSLAERLSSKFHICPQSFASRPNIHFSDNISRHIRRQKGFIY